MKLLVIYISVLVGSIGVTAFTGKIATARPCWCWPRDWHLFVKTKPHAGGTEFAPSETYDSEVDWNNAEHIIPLNYSQAQGKRVFYQQCVWCHADSTPAGPSNRSNVTPDPPLMNDGKQLNGKSDDALRRVITMGGSGVGKSAMMPPYGMTLTPGEINDVVEYMRVIAAPEYHRPPNKVSWFRRSDN
jgi:mono/diheme cytochrome c family protein